MALMHIVLRTKGDAVTAIGAGTGNHSRSRRRHTAGGRFDRSLPSRNAPWRGQPVLDVGRRLLWRARAGASLRSEFMASSKRTPRASAHGRLRSHQWSWAPREEQCVPHGARPGTSPRRPQAFLFGVRHDAAGWPGAGWLALRCERVRSAHARMRRFVDHGRSGRGGEFPAAARRAAATAPMEALRGD